MEIKFVNPAAEREFLSLPQAVQNTFEMDLYAIQNKRAPFSPITHLSASVGAGAIELKSNGKPAHRCVYCTKFDDTLYVLTAFKKTTNDVDRKAMALAKKRYKAMKELVG